MYMVLCIHLTLLLSSRKTPCTFPVQPILGYSSYLRGGIKIENRENLGQCLNGRGGGKKTEMSQFQFGNFENRGGGSLFFKNVPISIIFAIFCNFAFIKNV